MSLARCCLLPARLWPAIAVVASCALAPGQLQWRERESAPRDLAAAGAVAAAFDPLRARVVALVTTDGARGLRSETWEWDGERWLLRGRDSSSPAPRARHALAFDGERVVLFGGRALPSNRASAETWAWDGRSWAQLAPAASPSPRWGHAMAFEPLRGVIVLCGGEEAPDRFVGDTWQWDRRSGAWTRLAPPSAPHALAGAALVHDARRAELVRFGGSSGRPHGETWAWNGGRWIQHHPASAPSPRERHAMAYHGQLGRVVLFGGIDATRTLDDTWEWDGTRWNPVVLPLGPDARYGTAIAHDAARGHTLLFGGLRARTGATTSETWLYGRSGASEQAAEIRPGGVRAGARPTSVAASAATGYWFAVNQRPPARQQYLLTRCGTYILVFGGTSDGSPGAARNDVWRWDGEDWLDIDAPLLPSPRSGAAGAFHESSHHIVVFGGRDRAGTALDETWLWSGTIWEKLDVRPAPAARHRAAVAYDRARRRVVLFGGWDRSGAPLDDTWEWNGQGWTTHWTQTRPPARGDHALAYDAARQRVVLFGGRGSSGTLRDTWEWDGATWVETRPAGPLPVARADHALTYHERRGRVVLIGGRAGAELDDTWEYDGRVWRPSSLVLDVARAGHDAIHHRGLDSLLLFGGSSSSHGALDDTFELVETNPGSFTPFGAGCLGSAGVPQLAPVPGSLPLIGEQFAPRLAKLPLVPTPVLLSLGVSRDRLGNVPLPFDLAGVGAPGCALHQSMDRLLATTAVGSARWTLDLARLPASAVGAELFAQGAVLDRNANRAGLALSNAGAIKLGLR